jgi:hypothetical protein
MSVSGTAIAVGPVEDVRSGSSYRSQISTFSVTEIDWLSATGVAPTVVVTDNGPASTNATATTKMTAGVIIVVFTITETLLDPVTYFLCSDVILRGLEVFWTEIVHELRYN